MKFWKKSLMAKLVTSFFLLSIVTVGLVAGFAYIQANKALNQSIIDRLINIVNFKESELIRWVDDQEENVKSLASSPEIYLNLAGLINYAPADQEHQTSYALLARYLNLINANYSSFEEILILNQADGQVVFSTQRSHEGDYQARRTFFIEGQKGTYIQNIYPSSVTEKPALSIATPIQSADGQQLGVLVVHLDLERMEKILFEQKSLDENHLLDHSTSDSDTNFNAVEEIYIVDSSNQLVTTLNVNSELYRKGVHSFGINAAVQDGESGTGIYKNYAGVSVIGSYHWINELEVALIAEIPESQAFAPVRELAVRTVLVGLASAGILMLGVFILAQRIARPILAITDRAVQATMGDLSKDVPVMTEDEIGVLAVAFNTMQDGLRLYRQHLEEHAGMLERQVADRTQALKDANDSLEKAIASLEKANTSLSRHAVQLEASSQVSQQITSILERDKLLQEVATSIEDHFNYYFVGIWLLNKKEIVLQAGSDRSGHKSLGKFSQIPLATESLIVTVCKTGEYRLVDDVSQTTDYLPMEALPDTKSELTVPLHVGDKVFGALDIQSDKPADFILEDKLVFQTLADQISIAIRNAELYEKEQSRRELAESLEKTGRVLSSSLDLQKVPARILEQVFEIVPYERGSVMLEEGKDLRIVAQYGFPDTNRALQILVPITEGDVFQRAVATARPVLIDDTLAEPTWHQVEWLEVNRSWLGVPLITKNKVIGVISLTRKDEAAFSPEDAQMVLAFAGQAAIALENARLYGEITQVNEKLEGMVEKLNQTNQMLERLDKSKSDFILVISHELRTPLTVISGYGQIVSALPAIKEDPTAGPLLEEVIKGINRMYEIVNTILDVTKIDMHQLEVHKKQVSIPSLIESTYNKFEEAFKERNLNFETVDLDKLPKIQADSELLLKVFTHVLGNAIKYTPDGGSITVEGQKTNMNGNSGKDMPDEQAVDIIINDSGIGIAPENQDLIFEKFYQTGEVALHSSGQTKFKGGGSGIGLAIAKGIVLAHGGTIWVESEERNEEKCPGSRFHIRLPLG